MKVPVTPQKNPSAAHASTPFFKKAESDGFFGKTGEQPAPFFSPTPAPIQKKPEEVQPKEEEEAMRKEEETGVAEGAVVQRMAGAGGPPEEGEVEEYQDILEEGLTIKNSIAPPIQTPLVQKQNENQPFKEPLPSGISDPKENPLIAKQDSGSTNNPRENLNSSEDSKNNISLASSEASSKPINGQPNPPINISEAPSPNIKSGSEGFPNISYSPIPLEADNIRDLQSLVSNKVDESTAYVVQRNDAEIQESRTKLTAFKTNLKSTSQNTKAQLNVEINDVAQQLDTNHEKTLAQLDGAIQNAKFQIEGRVEAKLSQLETRLNTLKESLNNTVQSQVESMTIYGYGKASQIRMESKNREAQVTKIAYEVYGQYQLHEKESDVKEAIGKLRNTAISKFRNGGEEMAKKIEAKTLEMTKIWLNEVPKHTAKMDSTYQESKNELTQAKDWELEQLDKEGEKLITQLQGSYFESLQEIQAQKDEFDQNIESSKTDSIQQAEQAQLEFEEQLVDNAESTKNELLQIDIGLQQAIEQLNSEAGNFFNPSDAIPGLEASFNNLFSTWIEQLTGFKDTFQNQLSSASTDFDSSNAHFQSEAMGGLSTAYQKSQTGISQISNKFETDFGKIVDQSFTAIDNVYNSADLAITLEHDNIITAINQGVDQGISALDQTIFQFNTDHNGALYELRAKMKAAAEEAIKPWYQKLGEWIVDSVVTVFSAIGSFFVWLGKSIVNLVWGFIWGETAFPEAWGGDFLAFVGDVIAGILVYGDIRDVVKWGLIKPIFMGEGFSWLNLFMIGVSLLGLIPFVGDILKGVAKPGIKQLFKKLGKELLEKLLKELGEKAAKELIEEVGEEVIEKLAKELGEDALVQLIKELGEKGFKELVQKLGPDLVVQLSKELGTQLLKESYQKFGAHILKELAEKVGIKGLKELLGKVSVDNVKGIIEKVGVAGLKDLIDAIGIDTIQTLVQKFGTQTLGELTSEFTAEGVKKLLAAFGEKSLQEMVEDFGPKGLKKLIDKAGEALVKELSIEIGAKGIKQIVTAIGEKGLKELFEEIGVKGIVGLGADAITKIGTHLSPKQIGEFIKEVGEHSTKKIAKRYGGKAMAHYGTAFFKAWKGVTNHTVHHLLLGHGVKNKKISGCHDLARFLSQYVGSSATVEEIFIRGQRKVGQFVEFSYSLLKKDGSGLPKQKIWTKTVIDGLEANLPSWKKKIVDTLDDEIKNLRFPAQGPGFSTVIDGKNWEGFFRDGIIKTIFPVLN